MAFLIRQISRTAGGREIIRDRRVEADAVTIGRAADNHIALPDLSVSLYHGRIVREDGQRIGVSAIGTIGFNVDGRSRTQCVIDSAKGAEIAIGGNRITVSCDEGLVVLTVAVAARSETEEYEEAAAFSLKGKLPGKRASAWVLAILVLVAFLALPVWSYVQKQRSDNRNIYAATADRSWSSGPLSAAHHALENKCEACHVQAFVSVRDATCSSCHKDAHDHASAARLTKARDPPNFVGRTLERIATAFGKQGLGACVDCHTEHEGAGPMPPTAQAFCADCHGALASRLTDTKLGNASDFGTAHPQFRPLVSTAPGKPPAMTRVSLAAKPADEGGLKFPHKLHLDPLGGVARMGQTLKGRFDYGDALTCTDCHMPTADGARYVPVKMEESCQGCHSLGFDRVGGTVRNLRHGDIPQVVADLRALYRWSGGSRPSPGARRRPGDYAASRPSGGVRVGGNSAVTAAFSRGGACYDCHTVTPPGVGGSAQWSVTPVHQPLRYLQHGWFDHGAHKTETCTTCHAATQSSQASDLLLPGIETCRNCHGGEKAAKAKVPSSCAMCHSYHVDPGPPWKTRLWSTPRANGRGR